MSYREMAIDAGAQGEDEIRQMAQMIEEDHRRLAEEDAYARALEEEMMRRAYEEDESVT